MTRLSDGQCDRVEELLRSVATEVIAPAQADVSLLAGRDEPVTAVDIEAERLLTDAVRSVVAVPVIGEETAKASAEGFAALAGPGDVWLIDPIDGTGNYAAGSAAFGSMIAYVSDGETVASWTWSARHDGVFAARLGEGIACDGADLSREPLGESGVAQLLDRFMTAAEASAIQPLLCDFTLQPPSRCAAVDYPDLVTGALDLTVYRRVRPWDHAGGALLVSEAGGAAHCLDGRRYVPALDDAGLLVTATAELDEQLRLSVVDAFRSAMSDPR